MVFKLMYPSYGDTSVISFLSKFVCFDILLFLCEDPYLFIALEFENNFINKKSLQSHAGFTIAKKKFVTNALE